MAKNKYLQNQEDSFFTEDQGDAPTDYSHDELARSSFDDSWGDSDPIYDDIPAGYTDDVYDDTLFEDATSSGDDAVYDDTSLSGEDLYFDDFSPGNDLDGFAEEMSDDKQGEAPYPEGEQPPLPVPKAKSGGRKVAAATAKGKRKKK